MEQVWARLRRRTTSGAFIPEIDGLRFIAISGVVLYHLLLDVSARVAYDSGQPIPLGYFGQVLARGTTGVQLFFVVSGFILGLPFAAHQLIGAKPVSLRRYYFRRLTRLEPPYILALLISTGVVLISTFNTLRSLLPHVLSSLLYLHWLFLGGKNPANSVLWTLEIEVQFYMLAPVLALVFRVPEKLRRRATLLGMIVFSIWILPSFWKNTYDLTGYAHFFLAGFLIADIYVLDWNSPSRRSIWDILFVCSMIVIAYIPVLDDPKMVLCFSVIVVAVFRGRFVRAALTQPLVTTIGGMCYSIYLLHDTVLGPIVHRTVHIAPGLPFKVQYFVQIPLAGTVMLLILTCYYLGIEQPCMDPSWPSKLATAITSRIRRESLAGPQGSVQPSE